MRRNMPMACELSRYFRSEFDQQRPLGIFSKPAVDPVQLPESRRWIGGTRYFGIVGRLRSGERNMMSAN